jgi:hypothetical protein
MRVTLDGTLINMGVIVMMPHIRTPALNLRMRLRYRTNANTATPRFINFDATESVNLCQFFT